MYRSDVPTSGEVRLLPDPAAINSLGRNHSLATALADLVDNSIDAHATYVLIRSVRQGGRLKSLYVVDNGDGIPTDSIDQAMTIGKQREYVRSDLGHFGIGMKAASFSQAESLTVLSRAAGSSPVGRRWLLNDDRRGFLCDMVPEAFAQAELDRAWNIPDAGHGTIIRWDDVRAFPATDDPARIEQFITRTAVDIKGHLGLVFHRLLARNVQIGLDVEDAETGISGPRSIVQPLDPFGYPKSGKSGYPKELTGRSNGQEIRFCCHIWPGRSNLPQFRLPGGSAEDRQGFFFYRRDRLLEAGGDWHSIAAPDRRLQLARVAVDIDGDMAGLVRMNPEKSRVQTGPQFKSIAESALSNDGDCTSFKTYLQDAEDRYRESRQRSQARASMIPPGKGFAPRLRRAIETEIPIISGEAPIDIRWTKISGNDLFQVDRDNRTLWLNNKYRGQAETGERHGVNDAPLLKALLYLLVEDVFKGEYLGARDKDNIELWQEILTAAATSEQI
jgi:hypothetical protein